MRRFGAGGLEELHTLQGDVRSKKGVKRAPELRELDALSGVSGSR